MRPDTGPFLALSPFRFPVPLPIQDPDAAPTTTITISCSWLPYIRGALLALLMQYTWPQGDDAAVYLAQQRANTLIAMFTECAAPLFPVSCFYDYTISTAGWALDPSSFGVYTPAVGWQGTFVDGHSQSAIRIGIAVNSTDIITDMSMTVAASAAGSGANDSAIFYYRDGGGVLNVLQSQHVDAGTNVYVWSGSITGNVEVLVSVNSGDTAATVTITDVTVNGFSDTGCP